MSCFFLSQELLPEAGRSNSLSLPRSRAATPAAGMGDCLLVDSASSTPSEAGAGNHLPTPPSLGSRCHKEHPHPRLEPGSPRGWLANQPLGELCPKQNCLKTNSETKLRGKILSSLLSVADGLVTWLDLSSQGTSGKMYKSSLVHVHVFPDRVGKKSTFAPAFGHVHLRSCLKSG